MTDANQELMLEILKDIQRRVSHIESGQKELQVSLVRTREEIHLLGGHIISLEKSVMDVDQRVQRIEKRLDLVEA